MSLENSKNELLGIPKFHVITSILTVYSDLSGLDKNKYLDVGSIDWENLTIKDNTIFFRLQGEKTKRSVPLLPMVTLDSIRGNLSDRVSNLIQ